MERKSSLGEVVISIELDKPTILAWDAKSLEEDLSEGRVFS